MLLGEQVKPEMHQSMIEIGPASATTFRRREPIDKLRRTVSTLAGTKGLRIAAASTHPFSSWKDQKITPDQHYASLIDEMQVLADPF